MLQLRNLIPVNYLEEKTKFFADNSYNPQFYYNDKINPSDLIRYGFPQKSFLQKAEQIIQAMISDFGSESSWLSSHGDVLSKQKVENLTLAYFDRYPQLPEYKIVWSPNFVTKASVTSNEIRFNSLEEFRKKELESTLNHEIGSHILRRNNNANQPWFSARKKFSLSPYLRTEEGLAAIHGLLPFAKPYLYKSAVRYIAVQKALISSFSDTFKDISHYVKNSETCWMIASKQKRGLSDTSKPGAYTKDIVYLEGFFEVMEWLKNNDYNLPLLYGGKISVSDADRIEIRSIIQNKSNYSLILPEFYTQSRETYIHKIQVIEAYNTF